MRISFTLIILYSLMAFIIAVFGAPFIWMFVTSIKPDEEIIRYPIEWIPDNPTFEAYYRLFGKYPIMRWFFNSILIATITTLITIVTNLLAAYPLSKMRFKGKNIFLLKNRSLKSLKRVLKPALLCFLLTCTPLQSYLFASMCLE